MWLKRKDNNTKDKLTMYVTFFIIAPLISIALAYIAVNYVIVPGFIEKKAEIKQEEPDKATIADNQDKIESNTINNEEQSIELELKLNDVSFCSVQVGSFSDINNAKTLIDDMQSNKMAGFIVKLKDSYKVYSGVFTDAKHAQKHKEKVKAKYTDAFISSNLMNGGVIKYKEEEKEYVEGMSKILDCLTSSYETESVNWLETLKTKDSTTIVKSIKENNKKIIENIEAIGIKKSNNVQIKDLQESISQNLNKRESLVNMFKDTDIVEIYNQYNKCMVDYLNMIKLK